MKFWRLILTVTLTVGLASAHAQERITQRTNEASTPIQLSPDSRTGEIPLLQSLSIWHRLNKLTAEEKSNAVIDLALPSNGSEQAVSLARSAERAWNSGSYDKGLSYLTDLAAVQDMKQVEIGVQSRNPSAVSAASLLGQNVQIGLIDSIRAVDVVSDSATGSLYAVLYELGDGYDGVWFLYRSTDGGFSWTSSYGLSGMGKNSNVSITSVRGSIFVGYRSVGGAEARIRRFSATTGTVQTWNGGANFVAPFTSAAAESLVVIRIGSNVSASKNRLYCAVITSNRKVKFAWNFPDTTSWVNIPSTTSGAVGGLSLTFNATFRQKGGVYVSYMDSSGAMCVDSVGFHDRFGRAFTTKGGGTNTSIGAHNDTILVAYEYNAPAALTVRYQITYNGGDQWLYGTFEDSTATHESPVVTLDRWQGIGVFYRFYTSGGGREGRFTWRTYRQANWSTPENITSNPPHYWTPGITAMGNKQWGVVYITFGNSPMPQAGIFVSYQAGATAVEASGQGVPAAYRLYENFPNPFNPTTEIQYDLPVSRQVKLVVYDILGREVARLVDGVQSAGQKRVSWNAVGKASGVYFCRLQAGPFSAVRKMLLVR